MPIRTLKGFKRIFLKAGESKIVQFVLTRGDLSLVDNNGRLKQVPGTMTISVGGSQPDERTDALGITVEKSLEISM